MDLREVTTRFQTLCHEGFSYNQLFVEVNDKVIPIEDIKFEFKSNVMKDGYIALKLGDINENESNQC